MLHIHTTEPAIPEKGLSCQMAMNEIQRILDAEKAADKRLADAGAKAAQLQEKAEAEGRALYDKLMADGEARAAQINAGAEKEIAERTAKAESESDAECKAVKALGAGRVSAAADTIAKKVVMG